MKLRISGKSWWFLAAQSVRWCIHCNVSQDRGKCNLFFSLNAVKARSRDFSSVRIRPQAISPLWSTRFFIQGQLRQIKNQLNGIINSHQLPTVSFLPWPARSGPASFMCNVLPWSFSSVPISQFQIFKFWWKRLTTLFFRLQKRGWFNFEGPKKSSIGLLRCQEPSMFDTPIFRGFKPSEPHLSAYLVASGTVLQHYFSSKHHNVDSAF